MQKRAKKIADNLEEAMASAIEIAGTDKVIVFDGSYGSINLSPSMGRVLLEKAPEVNRKVDEELLPKWFRQRGFDVDGLFHETMS